MRCIGINRVKLNSQEGREELIKKVKILRSHHYTDEEVALDLGLTESEIKELDKLDAYVNSLI